MRKHSAMNQLTTTASHISTNLLNKSLATMVKGIRNHKDKDETA